MGTVTIWCWTKEYGKYLYNGTCFENMLLEELNKNMKYSDISDKIKILHEYVENNKGEKHPQDLLFDLFMDKVTIDFEFAKNLKLYDIVYPSCFSEKDEISKAFIDLLSYCDIEFILYMRSFKSINEITLDFSVCHSDYDRDLHSVLTVGGSD